MAVSGPSMCRSTGSVARLSQMLNCRAIYKRCAGRAIFCGLIDGVRNDNVDNKSDKALFAKKSVGTVDPDYRDTVDPAAIGVGICLL